MLLCEVLCHSLDLKANQHNVIKQLTASHQAVDSQSYVIKASVQMMILTSNSFIISFNSGKF